jgi:hypothetical protein
MILLSTNVKDEHNIQEWIKYHLQMGFDYILIFDDMSSVPVNCCNEKIQIIRHHAQKVEYMNISIDFAKKRNCEFLMYIDGDEYLYFPNHDIQEFISKIPPNVISIYFPWLNFGSNGHNKVDDGSCIYPYTKCSRKTHIICKPLVRVSCVEKAKNPHEYNYSKQQTLENTLYAEFKKLTKVGPKQHFLRSEVNKNTYCIAHYRTQSWEQFKKRKGRIRDDTGKHWEFPFSMKSNVPHPEFHMDSNQIEFLWVKQNFENKST